MPTDTKKEISSARAEISGKSGVVSASMLGLGRALGETMAVLMILSPGLNYSVKLLQASQNQTIASNIGACRGSSIRPGTRRTSFSPSPA